MREIKFRGKAKHNNNWYFGYLNYSKSRKEYYILEDFASFPAPIFENTTGQYTGLKDKNDVEIYEGDIIKGFIPEIASEPERKGIVKWGLYGWIVDFKLPKYENGIGVVGFCSFRNYEVIGKIYDNPELLESEEEE